MIILYSYIETFDDQISKEKISSTRYGYFIYSSLGHTLEIV